MAKKKPKLEESVKAQPELDWQGRYDRASSKMLSLDKQMQAILKTTGGKHNGQVDALQKKMTAWSNRRAKLLDKRDNPQNQPGAGDDVGVENPGAQPATPTAPTVPTTPGTPAATTPTAPAFDKNTLETSKLTPGTAPEQQSFQWQDGQAKGLLNNIASQSTDGVLTSFNTSANRLRERLDSATEGAKDSARNNNLSRGFGVSGINDAAVQRADDSGRNSYAQGLNELSNSFEQNRLRGLENAGQIGGRLLSGEETQNQTAQGDLNARRTQEQENFRQSESLKSNNAQSIDSIIANIQNSREQRMSDKEIEDLKAQLQREGYRSQEEIAKTIQKGENFRTGLEIGDNKYGTPGVPAGGTTGGSTGGTTGGTTTPVPTHSIQTGAGVGAGTNLPDVGISSSLGKGTMAYNLMGQKVNTPYSFGSGQPAKRPGLMRTMNANRTRLGR